jgi:hypothetical protein
MVDVLREHRIQKLLDSIRDWRFDTASRLSLEVGLGDSVILRR